MAKDDEQFDLDKYITENTKPAYEFTLGGRVWSMANLQEIDAWTMLAAADGGDADAATTVMEQAFGPKVFAEFKKQRLPQHALNELFTRYRKFCGVDEGDSPASTNSSRITARR